MYEIFEISNYGINPFALQTLIVILLIIRAGFSTLSYREGTRISRFLLAMCLVDSLWLFSMSMIYLSTNQEVASTWATLIFFVVSFVPFFRYLFTVQVLDLYDQQKYMVLVCTFVSTFFGIAAFTSNQLVMGVQDYWYGFYPKLGTVSLLFLTYYLLTLLLICKHFLTYLWREDPDSMERKRMLTFFVGFLLLFAQSIDFLPSYNFHTYPSGFVFVSLFYGILFFGNWRFRLVEITPSFASENILQTMPDPLVVTDKEGRIQIVNSACKNVFGYSIDELKNQSFVDLFSPVFGEEEHGEQVSSINEMKSSEEREFYFHTIDGDPIIVEASISELSKGGDQTDGYVIDARDLREIKKTDRQLEEREEQFQLLVEHIEDIFWIWDDQEDGFIYVSAAYGRIWGEPPDQLDGDPWYFLEAVHPEDRDRVETEIKKAIEKRIPLDIEYRIEVDPDETRWIWDQVIHIPRKPGQPDRMARVTKDITDRKELEQMRVKEQKQRLDEFVYYASHDLKEPLRKLISFSDLLEEDLGDDLPERARTDLDHLTDATERMQNIVESLLRLSRSRTEELERKRFSVDRCWSEALDHLSELVDRSNVEVRKDDPVDVQGDPSLLSRVYQNLIENAIKFSDEHRPVIELTVEDDEDPVVLGVRDHGIGIPEDEQVEIFKPFRRLHGRSEYEGTGLGLAVCRKIIERHEGTIFVESDPGEGAHFKFTLNSEYPEETP